MHIYISIDIVYLQQKETTKDGIMPTTHVHCHRRTRAHLMAYMSDISKLLLCLV